MDEIADLPLRRGIVEFRRSDYLPGPGSLGDAARALAGTSGPVRLLTNLRTFGHCFNPVSFVYCHDGHDRLQAVIAEVTNTPWGERPSLRFDSPPTPLIFLFSRSSATTEGSLRTMPSPFT